MVQVVDGHSLVEDMIVATHSDYLIHIFILIGTFLWMLDRKVKYVIFVVFTMR